MNKLDLTQKVSNIFNEKFNKQPMNVVLAPGRINIIGEHTDYNNGLSMPSAIDKWVASAISYNSKATLDVFSINLNKRCSFNEHSKSNQVWKKLILSVIHSIQKKYNVKISADIVVGGNIPIGCGLSSSTAFTISITQAILNLYKFNLNKKELADFCHKIENAALNMASGLLDQYAIIMSRVNKTLIIDFLSNSFDYCSINIPSCSWVIINSRVNRRLSNTKYMERVRECNRALEIIKDNYKIDNLRQVTFDMLKVLDNNRSLFDRVHHVISENRRVELMKKEFLNGKKKNIGSILKDSHESLKNKYEVSCEEIDYIIKVSAKIIGWYGGRIVGGGFGGCIINFIESKYVNNYIEMIRSMYFEKFEKKIEVIPIKFLGGL